MSKLVVFDNGMKGIDTQVASMNTNGSLTVSQLTCNGSLTNVGNLSISSGSNLTIFGGDILCNAGTLNCSAVSTSSTTTNTLTCNGDVGIGTTSPDFKLDVNGDMRVGTLNGGYIYWLRDDGGYGNRISIRGTYLGSDSYKLEFRVRGIGPVVPAMYLQRNQNGNAFLRVNGAANFGSDDRLKHNEVNLVNAIDTINKLQPKLYDKTAEMLDRDYNGPLEEGTYNKEVGFIAQEVYEINELKEFVDVGDEINPWGINYNALFSYNIGATQELYKLVQAQQEQINELKKRLDELT